MTWLKKGLLALLMLPIGAFATSIQTKLEKASTGSYVVTQQGRNTSVLHLHSKIGNTLLFEEITAPSFICDKISFDWKKWVANHAPGHTSWILYSLDLNASKITTCYSVDSQHYLSTQSLNAFFTTLCQLPLKEVSDQKRLQSSASMKPGEVGKQKPWSPPKTFEGVKEADTSFNLLSASWPKDTTPLSNETILAYFDATRPDFPFPLWVQAGTGVVKVKMRVIDAGYKMVSPAKAPLTK